MARQTVLSADDQPYAGAPCTGGAPPARERVEGEIAQTADDDEQRDDGQRRSIVREPDEVVRERRESGVAVRADRVEDCMSGGLVDGIAWKAREEQEQRPDAVDDQRE